MDQQRDGGNVANRAKASEITTDGICKTFGRFTALQDVSITVARGEFLTLLGPSGSGKTTFLMILAGFEVPTAGRLLVDGQDMTKAPPEQRAFGMVFQGYALFPHMTVRQNIAFPLRVQKRSAAKIARRTDEMIQMVGLEGHAHKLPAALSGGQQQRVALARALAYEPPVLLLDEPFSALDRNLRGQMQDELRRIHAATGTTFVFVTHDQSEALALSSRVAIFDHGRLQQIATPRQVYDRPATRFVAEFLGDFNILPLTEVAASGAGAAGRFEDAVLHIATPPPGPAALLAVRAEHMTLTAERPATANALPAHVTDLVYRGADIRVSLRTAGATDLILSVPVHAMLPGLGPGALVWVGWDESRGVFVQ